MTDTPDERPRPTPRPVPQARPGTRPSPRARVAGSRRDREERDAAESVGSAAPVGAAAPTAARTPTPRPASRRTSARPVTGGDVAARPPRRAGALALVLALLCLTAAAGAGFLLWQRLNPSYVDTSVLSATRSGVEALYAYDYKDSEGSVERKLAVLTGELREQYEADLSQGGILDTYEQVSATTSYEVLDVGLQRINEAQDTATLVVFGQEVVQSATTGQQPAPEGSECQVTPEGAQTCTRTLQVGMLLVDGEWKIDELTVLTMS